MLLALLQAAITIGFPALAIRAAKTWRVATWLGPVVLCYACGILMANAPGPRIDGGLAKTIAEASVPLALPLLLLSADLRAWARLARPTLLSLAAACFAAMVSSYAVGRLYAGELEEGWKMAGMLVGVYTGGTANMSAIGLALGAREEIFVLLNAADVLLGGLYFLFLLSLAQRMLLLFLPAFRSRMAEDGVEWSEGPPPTPKEVALCLGVAAAVLGASVGLTLLLADGLSVPLLLMLLTTLALAGSLSPRLRVLPGSWRTGEYLLLIFCVAVGSLADVRTLMDADPRIFLFTALVMFGAAAFHFALAALLRIDADTVLITSTATIFGPAFVGPVAQAIRNREVVVSGVASGLVGFAVGNYLGLATAYLLAP